MTLWHRGFRNVLATGRRHSILFGSCSEYEVMNRFGKMKSFVRFFLWNASFRARFSENFVLVFFGAIQGGLIKEVGVDGFFFIRSTCGIALFIGLLVVF